MATVSWKSGVSGNWNTDPSDWSTGTVPGAGDDATISVAGGYTVSLTSAVTINSITLGDTSATLAIADPSGTETVTGDLVNSGTLNVDAGSTAGGTTLTIGGSLINSGTANIGNGNLSVPTTVSAAALSNTGTINIAGNSSSATTNQATLDIMAG